MLSLICVPHIKSRHPPAVLSTRLSLPLRPASVTHSCFTPPSLPAHHCSVLSPWHSCHSHLSVSHLCLHHMFVFFASPFYFPCAFICLSLSFSVCPCFFPCRPSSVSFLVISTHQHPVSLRLSPGGKWVVSACNVGLWSLCCLHS